jgi:glycosyltransferase involved in cell wall biosynthesis
LSGPVLFLTPEKPTLGGGGGGLRSFSLLTYLRSKYEVETVTFPLRRHSKHVLARAWRNAWRLARGVPPLFDRFAGYEAEIETQLRHESYSAAVVEHFWCASYARLLRRYSDYLVLDLHNVESELARTHARAARWPESWISGQFARDYLHLERSWLPEFNAVLAASSEDLRRISHANAVVYPNALPEIERPACTPEHAIIFTGNLEYHPNIEAVRWFRGAIWPQIRERDPEVECRLAGVNPHAILERVASDPRIRVLGPVQDAIAAIAAAKLAIVPLLSGSGTRFKILEAWAAARPVVSTSLGAEGLGAKPGEHLLIADTASAFAEAVLRILNDPALALRLGEAGRALYLERFTWPAAWRRLEESGVL